MAGAFNSTEGVDADDARAMRARVDARELRRVLESPDRPLGATADAFAEAFPPSARFAANCALCVLLQVRHRPRARPPRRPRPRPLPPRRPTPTPLERARVHHHPHADTTPPPRSPPPPLPPPQPSERLSPHARLAALFLLARDPSPSPPSDGPFAVALADWMVGPHATNPERVFLRHVLGADGDTGAQTALARDPLARVSARTPSELLAGLRKEPTGTDAADDAARRRAREIRSAATGQSPGQGLGPSPSRALATQFTAFRPGRARGKGWGPGAALEAALRDAEAHARASRDDGSAGSDAEADAEAGAESEPERSSSRGAVCARWMDLRAETFARAPLGPADAPFARPMPPITRRLPGEPAWTEADPSLAFSGLGLGPCPAWDPGFGFESETRARLAALREAVAEATRAPLVPTRQARVLAAIESAPELAHRAGLSPETLPALVRHNPAVAAECLLRLGAASSEDGSYRDALVRIRPVSLHSMEVVNRLANAAELPIDFVKSYVGNCVQSCVEETDAGMRNRLVRLVCMFLQVLIRNRRVRVADLPEEVQAFCVEFMQSKEAATLFRLLKTHEGEGGGGGGADGDR